MAKEKKKKSQKGKAELYAKRRLQEAFKKPKINPFNMRINKVKQDVLGRKIKGTVGYPGISKSKEIDKLKKTLLIEYKNKDKDNIFVDRRIGAKNLRMTEEDKAMARYAAEKLKAAKKKNIFNLNDEEILTHRGQSIMDIEKYDDPRSDDDEYSDDENRTGKLDKKFVEDAHFGGGLLSKPNSEGSRKNMIDELIAESKKRKAERQKIREQTIDLTEKLDSEWHDLLPLVSSSNKAIEVVEEKTKADDYDIALREMKFEARGMATDRLKSEEEIATQEKLKLEKLEQDRLARMKGFNDDEDLQKKHRSADDLDDGFIIERIEDEPSDNETMDIKGILMKKDNKKDNTENVEENDDNENDEEDGEDNEDDDENNEDNEEDGDMGNEEDEEDEDEDDEEGEEEENEDDEKDDGINIAPIDYSEIEEESSDDESTVIKNKVLKIDTKNNINKNDNLTKEKAMDTSKSEETIESSDHAKKIEAMIEKAHQELPYTFKAPESYEELKNMFKNQSPIYQSVIVERIIKCNHWKLLEENKEKLLNLYAFLLQYLDDCASVNSSEELVKFFQIFDRLCPHFYDLTQANPEGTKNCLREVLKEKHTQFENNIKVYPDLDTLILFKLVSLLYPTSDFRHPVVTPCLVFMSQILLRCKVKRKSDITKGLFVCTLILEYTSLSKRWSPEVINFLRGVVYVSLPKPFSKVIKVIPPFKSVGETSNILVLEKSHKKSEVDPANVKMQTEDFIEEEMDDDYRIKIFTTAINLLYEFQELYSDLETAFVIFEPIWTLLKHGSTKRYPKKVTEKVELLINHLEKLKDRTLEPLMLDRKKPKALRMYDPKIEAVRDGKRHRPMSKEKAEREKLLHKLKREKRGVIRHLRHSTAFLAKTQLKEKLAADAERKRKVKEIFGEAAAQQSEFKKLKKK